jgi:hypothetical protein
MTHPCEDDNAATEYCATLTFVAPRRARQKEVAKAQSEDELPLLGQPKDVTAEASGTWTLTTEEVEE